MNKSDTYAQKINIYFQIRQPISPGCLAQWLGHWHTVLTLWVRIPVKVLVPKKKIYGRTHGRTDARTDGRTHAHKNIINKQNKKKFPKKFFPKIFFPKNIFFEILKN